MVRSVITWTPRILSILFILLLFMLSFDMLLDTYTLSEKVMGVLIQNLPTLVFAAVLFFSWKQPLVGGMFYLFAAFFYLWLMRNSDENFIEVLMWAMTLAGPALLTGVLFILDWKMNKRG